MSSRLYMLGRLLETINTAARAGHSLTEIADVLQHAERICVDSDPTYQYRAALKLLDVDVPDLTAEQCRCVALRCQGCPVCIPGYVP